MSFESEYKLESVAATRVDADKIDATFKSSTIGKFFCCVSGNIQMRDSRLCLRAGERTRPCVPYQVDMCDDT